MRIKIDELLEKKDKSRYWLAKEIGLTYGNLVKIANNETLGIKFETMKSICIALDCSLDELFDFKK